MILSDIQIGLAVKSARLASGWSAKQLAERSGLSATALSKIESGRQTLTLVQADACCSTLGIRIDHLVALAREVAPIASESATLRDRLRHDLRVLEQQTIKTAVAVAASRERKALAEAD